MNVGVIGYSGSLESDFLMPIEEICLKTGRVIARNNHILFTGGRDGVMELVSRGANEFNGTVVGILPENEPVGNQYNNIRIQTGMDYMMRSIVLVQSVDIVISIGGEIGTFFEIVSAYAYGKPVILFRGTGGWTDRVADVLIEGKYLDNRKTVEIKQVFTIEELERQLQKEAKYND